MRMSRLVALAYLQAEPDGPPIHFGSLGRDVAQSCGHAHVKFGGLSLPKGRARGDQENCWSKCAQQFTLAHSAHTAHFLSVDHLNGTPAHDKIRSNRQRQYLAQSSDHAQCKLGGHTWTSIYVVPPGSTCRQATAAKPCMRMARE